MITVSIIGGTGYTGSELLRILSNHPEVEIKYITSRKMDGVKITKIHPNLKGIKNLDNITFKNISPEDIDSDFVFCATPHGASMKIVPKLYEKGMKIIDLSGDYRFEDIGTYEEWYNLEHTGKLDAVYGLPELHREEIKKANLVANPGCFPTGSILALAPLVKEGIVEDRIIVDSKTGVSGAGVNPSETTHFPNVNENINPYKLTTHRHSPEIEKELEKLTNKNIKLSFTPHLVPITRGILTTTHTFLKENVDRGQIIDIYEKFYKNEPFVRIFDEEVPTLTGVRGSNFCDIGGFEVDRHGRLVVVSAIDNLVKGASGQAIHNMNLMAGFNETESLLCGGLKP
ncbi:N-acetyl-gamma-glutamyl-phosphate reductase [Methanothermococcus sp.]|uniref:N-acetyl-gamma-glutamyl-phosphate reductase n=1 Tax=Methanothermococcus sp. TaxID=2614238 RepID=UPI0025F28A36|nr:N-acetyl-gamma-glutamyl-phosphate reductase [Methanothermococcus sp.]